MGFSQFTLGFNGPDWPVDDGAAFLAWRDARNADGGGASGLAPAGAASR